MKEKIKYENIRKELKTGDIVLFSGGGFISRFIQVGTLSKWSHVGMVYELPEHDMLCIWESTSLSSEKDLCKGSLFSGVQMSFLSERLKNYNGNEIAIRKNSKTLTSDMLDALVAFRQKVKHKPYQQNKVELIKSALDGIPGLDNKEDLSSLFCSELLAEAYQEMGLLNNNIPSNEYTPKDWSSESSLLQLEEGYLEDEIYIDLLK